MSQLYLQSEPINARINIDGEIIENRRTPFLLKNLTPGTHSIEVIKEGYLPESRNIELKAGVIDTVSFNLQQLYGNLSIQVRPPS